MSRKSTARILEQIKALLGVVIKNDVFSGRANASLDRKTEDDLINAESALGRNLFGHIPEGSTREFFYHKKNTWIWYENGIIIHYEVRPHGVYKKAATEKYRKISGLELENFRNATKEYLKLVKLHLYR